MRGISVPFALVGSAQADHMNRSVSGCEHEHAQVLTDEAKGLKAPLLVVLAQILNDQRRARCAYSWQGCRSGAWLIVPTKMLCTQATTVVA
jgi:hypothetical protein